MADPENSVGSNGKSVICKRCNADEATQLIRTEKVCSKCFSQYVTTKAIKRMETHKMKGSLRTARKVLLALSFGPCSASLVRILDGHLQGQFDRMNRAAYELYIIHVDQHVDEKDRSASKALLDQYKARFPRHTYHSKGLEEALDLASIDWKLLKIPAPVADGNESTNSEKLQRMIGALPSSTSRTDILTTLLTRLLVDVAKQNDCESILFGESTTRLAEKTLTETAKGRGFSLPWQVSDGMSPYGIGFHYPLRDILKKELVTFSKLVQPSLTEMIIFPESSSNISASAKDTTIDDLMAQYFESVEKEYPSIVANVVRTSSKLAPLPLGTTTDCSLCGLPVEEGTDGIYGWGGDQNSVSRIARTIDQDSVLCYGCSRSING